MTSELPADNSDISLLSDSELKHFGITRALIPRWLDGGKSSIFKWVSPHLTPLAKHQKTFSLKPGLIAPTNPSWSGAVIASAPTNRIVAIEAQWMIPYVLLPLPPKPETYTAISWCGLDGEFGSGDVLQAGVIGQIVAGQPKYEAFYSWFPGGSVNALPVQPGNIIAVAVAINTASPVQASIWMGNQTTQLATTFHVTSVTGTPLAGTSAEWIVEGDRLGGALANFKSVSFTGCQAKAANGQVVQTAAGTAVNMMKNGIVECTAAIPDPTTVNVLYNATVGFA